MIISLPEFEYGIIRKNNLFFDNFNTKIWPNLFKSQMNKKNFWLKEVLFKLTDRNIKKLSIQKSWIQIRCPKSVLDSIHEIKSFTNGKPQRFWQIEHWIARLYF